VDTTIVDALVTPDTQVIAYHDSIKHAIEMLLMEVPSTKSKRAYIDDTLLFLRWLTEQQIELSQVDYDIMLTYRAYLTDTYSNNTAMRRFVVVRRFLNVALRHGLISQNPAREIRTKIHFDSSSSHTALTKKEAKKLLSAIDRSTPIGKRDYALIMLLLYTGIRRSECADATLGDITSKQEHKVLTIQHGKGDKRRDVPIRPDVFRALTTYLETVNRLNDSPESNIFHRFIRGNHSSDQGISDKAIENIVKKYAALAGVKCTPHDIRASFITFAMDTGVPLIQVQRLAGHSDPKTTERYYSRKQDLDNSAVYKIDLDA